MQTPLGTEVDLGPGHMVLDGDLALPPRKGHSSPSPLFGPCLLWPRSSRSPTAELLSTDVSYGFMSHGYVLSSQSLGLVLKTSGQSNLIPPTLK